MTKWIVSVHGEVEVEAENDVEACNKAIELLGSDIDDHLFFDAEMEDVEVAP